jgi:hypothetical protein
MNEFTHRLEAEGPDTPVDAKRLEIGEIVDIKGWKYSVKSVDVAKQQVLLKLRPKEGK